MKKLLLFLFIGLISVAFAGIGKVTGLKGEAVVERAGKTIHVVKSMEIEKHDVIKTLGDGRVKLTFNDNTVISLGKKAVFSIAEYINTNQKNPKASFSIAKGAFKAITGKIGKVAPKKFLVKTRNATIGIRGTVFLGHVYQQAGKEDIACTQGGITVTSGNKVVNIDAGNYVKIENGKTGDVKPIDPQIQQIIEEDVATSQTNEDENSNVSKNQDATDQDEESDDSGSNDYTSATSTSSSSSTDSTSDTSDNSDEPLATWSASETGSASTVADETTTDATSSIKTDSTTSAVNSATNLSGYQLSGNKYIALTDRFIAKGTTSYKYDAISKYSAQDYTLTQNLQSSTSTSTTTISDNFTHTPANSPVKGGYTGFSQITTSNPLSYSFTTQSGATKTGDYTLYMDNMGEFLVGYANSGTEFYDLFYAGSKSDATGLDSSKYYIYSEFKGIQLVMKSDDTVLDVKFDTTNSTYKNIYLNAKLKIVIPESQFTEEEGAREFGSYTVANDGSIGSGVHYYQHYSGANGAYSATSKGTALDGAIYGTDFQGLGVAFEDKEYQNYGSSGSTNTQTLLNTDYNAHTAKLTGSAALASSYVSGKSMKGYIVYSIDAGNSASRYDGLGMTINSTTGSVSTVIDQTNAINLKTDGTISGSSSYYLNDDAFGSMIKSGSTITDGGKTYKYIDDSGWFVSRADEYDSTNSKFVVNNDDYSSWGYWTGEFVDTTNADSFKHVDMRSTWIVGDKTNAADMTTLISKAGSNPVYNGHVLGFVTDGTNTWNVKLDSTNKFKATFDLSASSATLNNFEFTDSNNVAHDLKAAGVSISNVTNSGFTIEQSGTKGSGTFYGPNAESIGGGFSDITQGSFKASGVFKAAR